MDHRIQSTSTHSRAYGYLPAGAAYPAPASARSCVHAGFAGDRSPMPARPQPPWGSARMLAPRASLPSARPQVCSGVPPREGASAIPYCTAELTGANTEGICLGLSAEWLRRLGQSPADRMAALARGTASHAQAGQWQRQYADGKAVRRSSGTQTADADIQAQNAVLRAAGLSPADSDEVFDANTPDVLPYVSDTIAVSGTKHLLGLYFADGTAHTVATSSSGRRTTVFDPNHGEFEARSREVENFLESLIQRYREHGHSPVAISLQVLQ